MDISPSQENQHLFWTAVTKDRADLTPEEFRAIVACFGWMDDDERTRFAIKRADLTDAEIQNYAALHLLNTYFPE